MRATSPEASARTSMNSTGSTLPFVESVFEMVSRSGFAEYHSWRLRFFLEEPESQCHERNYQEENFLQRPSA